MHTHTVVKCAFDDGHFGVNDPGFALEHACHRQSVQKVFQQISQAAALGPAQQRLTAQHASGKPSVHTPMVREQESVPFTPSSLKNGSIVVTHEDAKHFRDRTHRQLLL